MMLRMIMLRRRMKSIIINVAEEEDDVAEDEVEDDDVEDDDVKGEEEDDAENDDVEAEEDDDTEEEEEDRSHDPRVWTHCVGNSRCSRDC